MGRTGSFAGARRLVLTHETLEAPKNSPIAVQNCCAAGERAVLLLKDG